MEDPKAKLRRSQEEANAIRRGGQADPHAAFELACTLANARCLDEARTLAQFLADSPELPPELRVPLGQKWALWTSQNPDAPDDSKHEEALHILEYRLPGLDALSTSTDPETLGIAGGICKRMWQVDGLRQTLERSLAYYERGAAGGVAADNGYTAINTAFVLDLLASRAVGMAEADTLRARARQWREQVRDELAPHATALRSQQVFFWETLAEAHFGLHAYGQAVVALKMAYDLQTSRPMAERKPWEVETTARQFAWLARLHEPTVCTPEQRLQSPAWKALHEVYGNQAAASTSSLFAGKLGLSLSGGGFRASLFHIGVLAAMAERDMLRHVEVLSCVSGGSILGAHYYLEVRNLLQSKPDREIDRKDYIDLIDRLAHDFLGGVQKNMRVRIGTSLWANLRMLFEPGYTTTTRLAELYEEHLYKRVKDDKKRALCDLQIRPQGDKDFKPKYGNWQRANKVPILILNATTLNTGHNWQFTTSWMGEPPSAIDSHIDGNYRLRRMYIDEEAPEPYKQISLGHAVAASSCVPGLFTPLELKGLYPDVTVRLVDGGVHDNQGIFGLLDQNCNVLMVSDASGQMSSVDKPADGPLGVLLRTTSLLQARIRVACFREIEARRKTGRLRGMLFLHLKRGLEVEPRDWVDCNPKELSIDALRQSRAGLTDFHVLKRVQEKLAGIRTDLDSFNDAEAFALMTSGYNMVRTTFDEAISGFEVSRDKHDWHFLKVEPMLRDERHSKPLDALLAVSGMTMFKLWRLSAPLRVLSVAMLVALVLMLVLVAWGWHDAKPDTFQGVLALGAFKVLILAVSVAGLGGLVKLISWRKTVHQVLIGAALASVGTVVTNIHLRFFDRRFLKRGAVTRNERMPTGPDQTT